MKKARLLILFFVMFIMASSHTFAIDNSLSETPAATVVFFDQSASEIVINNTVTTSYVVQVFDLTGQQVSRLSASEGTSRCAISTSSFKRGIYLVRVTPSTSNASVTVKVMVQ